MRAVVVTEQGGPHVLRVMERETPTPAQGQIRVNVEVAGINFLDIYERSGTYPMQTPFVAGSEGAGRISAVGDGVPDFTVGDRVAWAMTPGTGYTEQTLIAADRVVKIPDSVTAEQAAAVLLQGMTAHYLVESAFHAEDGQTAVVHAAAGGVGLLLCQMLAAKGVKVIGTTSGDRKAELAREAGATEVIICPDGDFAADVRRISPDGVDVVYDGVGAATFEAGLDTLRPRGSMVLFGGSSGQVKPLDPQVLNAKGSLFLTRPSLAHYIADREELIHRAGAIFSQVEAGKLHVRIGGRYRLDEAARAHTELESRRTTGKLVLVNRL